jgi:hypothetical protein
MPEVYEFLEAERINYAIRLPANQILQQRQSCSKAGKARIFALVWESSGESRFNAYLAVARRLKPKVRS